jgi:imidazolonepropionase-like amidohydrolase
MKSGPIIELTNARFVDVINGEYFPENTVLFIQGDRIISIIRKSEGSTGIDPDISIDLMGLTVMPGLFNTHCHIQMINPTILVKCKTLKEARKFHDIQVDRNMEECVLRGITNIRDAFTEDLSLNRKLIERIKSGEIKGPRIQQAVVVGPAGGYLSPESGGINDIISRLRGHGKIDYNNENCGVVAFPMHASAWDIRAMVDLAIQEKGADLIKVGESMEKSMINRNPIILDMDQLSAISGQAAKRGLQSTIHAVSLETFRRATAAGFSSIAHLPRDGMLSYEDAERCLKADCIIDPTFSVAYEMSWKLGGTPSDDNEGMESLYRYRNLVCESVAEDFWIPELNGFVKDGFNRARNGKYNMFGLIGLSGLLSHFSGLPAYGFKNARILHENGISLSCGNDGGIQSCTPASISVELELMGMVFNSDDTDVAFKPAEVIKAATINSARSMGLEDSFGSIETGKIADLIVLNGDPFEDSSIIGKPVDALFMDGKLILDRIGIIPDGSG